MTGKGGSNTSNHNAHYPVMLQVLYMTGWAPHGSQQKPARRGSATVSFEDLQQALGDQADKTANEEK